MKILIIIIIIVCILYKCNDAHDEAKYQEYMSDIPEGDRQYHQRKK